MNKTRIYEVLEKKEIRDIYYDENPVWIQEVKDDIARVGFLDGSHKDVYIDDLYERNLYD